MLVVPFDSLLCLHRSVAEAHKKYMKLKEKQFSVKKKNSFACENGVVQRTETRQRLNHKDGREQTQEEYPTSVPCTR